MRPTPHYNAAWLASCARRGLYYPDRPPKEPSLWYGEQEGWVPVMGIDPETGRKAVG